MDIPVYHKYTISYAWEVAKMQLGASDLGWLEKRSKCLGHLCKHFYNQQQKMLDEDHLIQQEPEDTPMEMPHGFTKTPIHTPSLHRVGLGERLFSLQGVQVYHAYSNLLLSTNTHRSSLTRVPHITQHDPKMVGEDRPDHATKDLHSAPFNSSLGAISERKPISAYFSYYSPEEDEPCETEVAVSSPNSISSDETWVNTPDRAVSPSRLEPAELKLGVNEDEEDEEELPPCCNKIKEEWELVVKVIEGTQETEIADLQDDFECKIIELQSSREEDQRARQSLEAAVSRLEQNKKEYTRKLREKSKELRELRTELDEFTLEKQTLERDHEATLLKLNERHKKEVHDLKDALHIKTGESDENAALKEEWKEKATKLQAQHDDSCQRGMSCTQQIDDLKCQIGKQERWLRQNWPIIQNELQDASTNMAVAQKDLEDARNESAKVNLRFARSQVKLKAATEELKQARKMLLADDSKAASAQILQESADEMANLMTQNHDRVVEILGLYRKRDIIVQGHQDQANACYAYIGELEVDRENSRNARVKLESDYATLRGQYQSLESSNTGLQIANYNLQIANNDLQIKNHHLANGFKAL